MDDLETILRRHAVECGPVDRIETAPGELVRYELVVPGTETLATWKKLRAIVAETGCWPVVIGEASDPNAVEWIDLERAAFTQIAERVRPSRDEVAEILIASELLTAESRPDPSPCLFSQFDDEAPGDFLADPQREWRGELEDRGFSFEEYANMDIVLLPTQKCWETPAFLGWGGWKDCPYPDHHVARLKRWHAAYGAELVALIDVSTMHLHVKRPPQRRQDALLLAKEHYLYADESIVRSDDSLEKTVAIVQTSRYWYFWWT